MSTISSDIIHAYIHTYIHTYILQSFRAFDKNHSGTISMNELTTVMRNFGESLTVSVSRVHMHVLHVHMHVFICMLVYMYVCVYICTHMHAYMHTL